MSPPLPQTRNIQRSGNISMHGGHLLCPVIRTSSESSNTGSALQRETERRITPETSGKTTVNSIRCLHIGQGAGNVILHPLQIFILDKEEDKKNGCKKGNAAIYCTESHLSSRIRASVGTWGRYWLGLCPWAWLCRSSHPYLLSTSCLQLPKKTSAKVGILARSRREETR